MAYPELQTYISQTVAAVVSKIPLLSSVPCKIVISPASVGRNISFSVFIPDDSKFTSEPAPAPANLKGGFTFDRWESGVSTSAESIINVLTDELKLWTRKPSTAAQVANNIVAFFQGGRVFRFEALYETLDGFYGTKSVPSGAFSDYPDNRTLNVSVAFDVTITDSREWVARYKPFPKRSPRRWGRAWTPRWEREHASLVAAKKFTRNTERMKKDPNAGKLGKKGTESFKSKMFKKAKEVASDAAMNALKDGAKHLKDKAKKKVASTLKKRVGNALKRLVR